MVKAWYMADVTGDQRDEHQLDPPHPLTIDEVKDLTGVLYWHMDLDTEEGRSKFSEVKRDRGYSYEDTISVCKEMPNYEAMIKKFFAEHIHADEEIRMCLEGSGYFDVRTPDKGRWIRVEMQKNDLLVLPAGIYHRFTLDRNNYIKANRLFVGEPVWVAIDAPAEDHVARKQYLQDMAKAAA